MTGKYICKAAVQEEMERRWEDEIALHAEKGNWLVWRDEAIASFRTGRSIPYYGILDGKIICEATVVPDPDPAVLGGLPAGCRAAELCAFRTVRAHRGQGWFSRLMDFLQRDLRERGFTFAVVGVEPSETRNLAIYRHWGFVIPVGTGTETYPDGTVIDVAFYGKHLEPAGAEVSR